MGRRKGRPVSGWLVVDKPAGPTSTAVVNRLRHALGAAKAGHAGTLDPAATGLLAVAFGEATKTIPYLAEAEKCYRFAIRFGTQTSTDDAGGTVIATSAHRPDTAAIRAALPRFTGAILQVPPQVSAVRVDGERAYDLAREGEVMELAARPLTVARLELLARDDPDSAEFEMVCGKGGYVRSIARDLGLALGTRAHVLWLRRLWSGPFAVDRALTPEAALALAGAGQLEAALLPVEAALAGLPQVRATAAGAVRLRNGNPGEVTGGAPAAEAWASHEGRILAIGPVLDGALHPHRVFNL